MTIAAIIRTSRFTAMFSPYSPFVWSAKVRQYSYASFWTTTFSAPDDSGNVKTDVRQIFINYLDKLLEAASLNDCLAQAESFYYDDAAQAVYVHFSHSENPFTSQTEFGYAFGISSKELVSIGGYDYLPLIKSIPNMEQSAEPVGADEPAGIAGSLVARNLAHIDPVTLRREGMLDFVLSEPVRGNDVFISDYDPADGIVTPLASMYIEDYSISQKSCTLNLQDKRAVMEKKIPAERFSAATFPFLDDSSVDKPIPVMYGHIAAIPLVCINPNENEESAATHALYKLPAGTSDIGTAYVEVDDTWKAATGVIADYELGTLEISNGRNGSGSSRKVKLVDPVGYMFSGHCYPRQAIQSLLENGIGIKYTASNFDTAAWEAELDSAAVQADIGFLIDKETEIRKVIFDISVKSKAIFRVWHGPDGRLTAKVKDYERASSRSIPSAEIKNATELEISTRGDEVYSSVVVKYGHNYVEDVDLTAEERGYYDEVVSKYRKFAVLEIESHLVSTADAVSRAAAEALNVSEIPSIVELELFGNLGVQLYDAITVAIKPDNLDASAREYAGNRVCLALSVDPDCDSRINHVTAVIIGARVPLDSQSSLGSTAYSTVTRALSSADLVEQKADDAASDAATAQATADAAAAAAAAAQASALASRVRYLTTLSGQTGLYDGELVTLATDGHLYQWSESGASWTDTGATKPRPARAMYNFIGVPEIPDNPAGTTYRNVPEWASGVDGWTVVYGCTLAISGGKLVLTGTGTHTRLGFYKIIAGNAKTLRIKLPYDPDIIAIEYYNGSALIAAKLIRNGEFYLADILMAITAYASVNIYIGYASTAIAATKVVPISDIYIGDGSYTRPAIDNSGNGHHASLSGITPGEEGVILDGVNDRGLLPLSATPLFGVGKYLAMAIDFKPTSSTAGYVFAHPDTANANRFYLSILNGTTVRVLANTGTSMNIPCATNERVKIFFIRDNVTGVIKAYKAGSLVGQLNTVLPVASDPATIPVIGANNSAGAEPGKCEIYSVAFFTESLPAEEIRALSLGILPDIRYTPADYATDQAANDGIITPGEKTGIKSRWDEINGDGSLSGSYWAARAEAVTLGISGETAATAAQTKRDALYAYLYTSPAVLALSYWDSDITVDKATYLARWAEYRQAEGVLLNAIATKRASNAQAAAIATAAADATAKANAATAAANALAAALHLQTDKSITTYDDAAPYADPSSAWTTNDLKRAHHRDIWHKVADATAPYGSAVYGTFWDWIWTESTLTGAWVQKTSGPELVSLQNAAAAQSAADDAASDAATAQGTADGAASAASAAQASANSAIADIAVISSDDKFSAVEKSTWRLEWNTIAAELSVNDAQATAFGITTEKTAYDAAFQALATYLNAGTAWTSGIPSWIADANLATTTTIVGATFRANWKSYYDARTALLNKIADVARVNAATAQTTADKKTTKWGSLALANTAGNGVVGDSFLDASLGPAIEYRCTVAAPNITVANSTRITPYIYPHAVDITARQALTGMIYGDRIFVLSTNQHYVYTTSWIPDGPIIPTTAAIDVRVATVAPKYWGRYLDSAPTANAVDDCYTRYSATSGAAYRGVFRWTGSAWSRTEDRKYIMQALSDISFIIAYKNTASPPVAIYGTAADYTSDATTQADFAFFQSAVVGYLEAGALAVKSATSGARVEILKSGAIALHAINASDEDVFRAFVGTSGDFGVGDVAIGKVTGPNDSTNSGMIWDESTGRLILLGSLFGLKSRLIGSSLYMWTGDSVTSPAIGDKLVVLSSAGMITKYCSTTGQWDVFRVVINDENISGAEFVGTEKLYAGYVYSKKVANSSMVTWVDLVDAADYSDNYIYKIYVNSVYDDGSARVSRFSVDYSNRVFSNGIIIYNSGSYNAGTLISLHLRYDSGKIQLLSGRTGVYSYASAICVMKPEEV